MTQPETLTSSDGSGTEVLGLGYSVFQLGLDGKPIRVSPTSVFRDGDKIRVLLEPNTSGYVYIFHRENDSAPQMLYPSPRLNHGENKVASHRPIEIPSRAEPRPDDRWFEFDKVPAREQLYFVVTSAPIPGVPTGEDLVRIGKAYPDGGNWQPPATVWEIVEGGLGEPASESVLSNYGGAETSLEAESLSRGLGLPRKAPQPAVVRVCASASAKVMVTKVVLLHE